MRCSSSLRSSRSTRTTSAWRASHPLKSRTRYFGDASAHSTPVCEHLVRGCWPSQRWLVPRVPLRMGRRRRGVPTFNADVAPILYENCATCHRKGQVAPMPLTSYPEARPWARSIKAKVVAREMPPWFADPRYGHFKDVMTLSQTEIDTIAAWADGGGTAGRRSCAGRSGVHERMATRSPTRLRRRDATRARITCPGRGGIRRNLDGQPPERGRVFWKRSRCGLESPRWSITAGFSIGRCHREPS